jgi:hypothetical protein
VNFAVSLPTISQFLRNNHVSDTTARTAPSAKMSTADIGEKAGRFTVKVYCYGDPPNKVSSSPSPPGSPSAQTNGGLWGTITHENLCILSSKF